MDDKRERICVSSKTVQCNASHAVEATYCSNTEIIFSATSRMSIKSSACKYRKNVQ